MTRLGYSLWLSVWGLVSLAFVAVSILVMQDCPHDNKMVWQTPPPTARIVGALAALSQLCAGLNTSLELGVPTDLGHVALNSQTITSIISLC